MNLYSILFLLAAYLTFSDACLVIRYDEPPSCACKTLKLDSSNVKENEVKDNALYNLVLSSEIKSPEILIDDCSVQVRCEDRYELNIFDTDKGAKIGDFALDGFCDPFQQKWQVDTGNGMEQYKELKGVCVSKKVEKCSPTDPATFLFAYSNDLDYSDVAKLYSEYGSGVSEKIKYTVVATVRFDTKTKEDIVFHEGETVVDSYNTAYSYLNRTQVDTSQRIDSSETGSDILDRFIDTNRLNICGSMALILMKRSSNEVEISKIVEKLREYHIMLVIAVTLPSSGGLYPETVYNLATRTNGFCAISDFPRLNTLPKIHQSYMYYASSVQVSGTGITIMDPVIFPGTLELFWAVYVQSKVAGFFQSFQNITLRWYDSQSGIGGKRTITLANLTVGHWTTLNSYEFPGTIVDANPSNSNVTLEYNYLREDTFMMRMASNRPIDHWYPFQD
ncbi:unnamed protein product [Caenorhabditis nigoni]